MRDKVLDGGSDLWVGSRGLDGRSEAHLGAHLGAWTGQPGGLDGGGSWPSTN